MTSFLSESSAFSSVVQKLIGSSVLVLGHRRPDGDCIGSQVAITRILMNQGINAVALNHDPVQELCKSSWVILHFMDLVKSQKRNI